MSARTIFRATAEQIVRRSLKDAKRFHLSARALRRTLREEYADLLARSAAPPRAPLSVWYAAIRAVAGCGVLSLPDHAQVELVPLGERTARGRRKGRGVR